MTREKILNDKIFHGFTNQAAIVFNLQADLELQTQTINALKSENEKLKAEISELKTPEEKPEDILEVN